MKLIIQIPSYNEAKTLAATIEALPTSLDGIDVIERLIIDDGSSDETVEVAKAAGVEHIIRHPINMGLARAFTSGLREALKHDPDIIVNTDADNQYQAQYIQDIINPILNNEADLVVGCRPIQQTPHFSKLKKRLQRFGSKTVQLLTGVPVPDVTSGFRAYSRFCAQKLRVYSEFTYTIETLIQAAKSNLRVTSVQVETNPPVRPSRLFRSNWYYIRKQTLTILRIWALYSPVKLFSRTGIASLSAGFLLFLRFFYYYLSAWPDPSGKVQSLIVASMLMMFGFFMILIGVLADLIAVNRRLLEESMEITNSKRN